MGYACEVWDGCTLENKDNLEKLQLEAARIITGLPSFTSRQSLYFETEWKNLDERRENRKLNIFFYKMHDVNLANQISNYNLRNNDNYLVPRCKLSVYEKIVSS